MRPGERWKRKRHERRASGQNKIALSNLNKKTGTSRVALFWQERAQRRKRPQREEITMLSSDEEALQVL